jgi:hypothetical protein
MFELRTVGIRTGGRELAGKEGAVVDAIFGIDGIDIPLSCRPLRKGVLIDTVLTLPNLKKDFTQGSVAAIGTGAAHRYFNQDSGIAVTYEFRWN